MSLKKPFLILLLCFHIGTPAWHAHAANESSANTKASTPTVSASQTVTQADVHNPESVFFKYLNSYFVAQTLYQNAVQNNNKLLFQCNERYNVAIGKVDILNPVTFQNQGKHPLNGVWKHNYTLSRCNKEITYNVYFVAQNGLEPTVIAGPLGHTRLSLEQILEVTPEVYKIAAAKLLPGCDEADFNNTALTSDTIVVTEPQESEGKRSWQEEWHVLACMQTVVVAVKLTEDLAMHKLEYELHQE